MGIADWPAAERPRERLLARGAVVLSDAELLSLLLRTGMAGRSAIDVARDLMLRLAKVDAGIALGLHLGRSQRAASQHGC